LFLGPRWRAWLSSRQTRRVFLCDFLDTHFLAVVEGIGRIQHDPITGREALEDF
jgi:hypothetical protein